MCLQHLPPHYDNAHCVIIWQSEQTCITQASVSLEDRIASGSRRRGLNGNGLPWRKPKLLVSPYSGEEDGACSLVRLIVFGVTHSAGSLSGYHAPGVWSLTPQMSEENLHNLSETEVIPALPHYKPPSKLIYWRSVCIHYSWFQNLPNWIGQLIRGLHRRNVMLCWCWHENII